MVEIFYGVVCGEYEVMGNGVVERTKQTNH